MVSPASPGHKIERQIYTFGSELNFGVWCHVDDDLHDSWLPDWWLALVVAPEVVSASHGPSLASGCPRPPGPGSRARAEQAWSHRSRGRPGRGAQPAWDQLIRASLPVHTALHTPHSPPLSPHLSDPGTR